MRRTCSQEGSHLTPRFAVIASLNFLIVWLIIRCIYMGSYTHFKSHVLCILMEFFHFYITQWQYVSNQFTMHLPLTSQFAQMFHLSNEIPSRYEMIIDLRMSHMSAGGRMHKFYTDGLFTWLLNWKQLIAQKQLVGVPATKVVTVVLLGLMWVMWMYFPHGAFLYTPISTLTFWHVMNWLAVFFLCLYTS